MRCALSRPSFLSPTLWAAIEPALDRSGLVPGSRVVVAMSGGVDSSVAAALMHALGFEVIGISMQLFSKKIEGGLSSDSKCCTLDDFQDARRVAYDRGFAHYVLDFQARFHSDVIKHFVEGYQKGETPSPCINCNQNLKFDALVNTSNEVGADFVVTGHYARILQEASGRLSLRKAADPYKDQSYFLFSHTQTTLARTLMPLGGLHKPEVRELGRQLGLHLTEKAESQEICFVETGRYDAFLEQAGLKGQLGEIRHVDGRILGNHEGYWRFTIGQRRGLKVAAAHPLYVVRVDPVNNVVWVGEEEALFSLHLRAQEVSWIHPEISLPIICRAKIRSRSPEAEARVKALGTPGHVEIRFSSPQRAIAPGQAVVFYEKDEVLGGGWIHA